MRFTVDPEGLQGDSGVVGAAGRELSRVDVGAELAPLAVAFPGGLTAAAVREMGERWADRLLAVRLGAAALGDGLGRAAASYAQVESVVRRALEVAEGGPRG